MGTRVKTKIDSDGKPRHFIREWRKKRGLTLEKLAGELEVATSSLSQLETGKQGYSQPMLEAIADALGCDPGDLLTRDPASESWRDDIRKLVRKAFSEGASPADIRAVIERIAPLPDSGVVLDPAMTDDQEQLLKDLSETSASQLDNRRSKGT